MANLEARFAFSCSFGRWEVMLTLDSVLRSDAETSITTEKFSNSLNSDFNRVHRSEKHFQSCSSFSDFISLDKTTGRRSSKT